MWLQLSDKGGGMFPAFSITLFQVGFHNAHVQKPRNADVWALQTAYNMLADRLGIPPNPPFTRYLNA